MLATRSAVRLPPADPAACTAKPRISLGWRPAVGVDRGQGFPEAGYVAIVGTAEGGATQRDVVADADDLRRRIRYLRGDRRLARDGASEHAAA
jgi:hypothetical protein